MDVSPAKRFPGRFLRLAGDATLACRGRVGGGLEEDSTDRISALTAARIECARSDRLDRRANRALVIGAPDVFPVFGLASPGRSRPGGRRTGPSNPSPCLQC